MKKANLLLLPISLLTLAAITVLAQLPSERTIPSKPQKGIMLRNAGRPRGAETRAFRVAGREYSAVLPRRNIEATREWNPSSALPTTLGQIEAAARGELTRLVPDTADWETSNIQLNRLSDTTESKWYYAVTFSPVIRLSDAPSDNVVVLLTIDGKPGLSATRPPHE